MLILATESKVMLKFKITHVTVTPYLCTSDITDTNIKLH